MNANFLAFDNSEKMVLRIYSTDMRTAQKEFDLLNFLKKHPVAVPTVHNIFEVHDRPVVIMEFLEGMTLEDRILERESVDLGIYEQIGAQLGEIHNIRFSDAGFLGPNVQPGKEFDNFSLFLRQFIEKTLTGLELNTDRLDIDVNKRLRRLIEDKWKIVLQMDPQAEPIRQLVHCDFNPKNILVSKGEDPQVTGIIDWEFADSGNGLIDIGNFFRFAYDYPAEARERFISGYSSTNVTLPANWETGSILLDLANMCSFLERKENYQESFRTARAVINSTLIHFGY